MRVRRQSADGDYTFGQGSANYLVDIPAAVAQSVQTRLLLFTGEWFLDKNEGMPWGSAVLGKGTKALYDQAIQLRVLETDGVISIDQYDSVMNDPARHLSVSMTITTRYGQINVDLVF